MLGLWLWVFAVHFRRGLRRILPVHVPILNNGIQRLTEQGILFVEKFLLTAPFFYLLAKLVRRWPARGSLLLLIPGRCVEGPASYIDNALMGGILSGVLLLLAVMWLLFAQNALWRLHLHSVADAQLLRLAQGHGFVPSPCRLIKS